MLTLVLTPNQSYAVYRIATYGSFLMALCTPDERRELVDAGYCWCDGSFLRAHETYAIPDFEMCEPDERGSTSEAADRQFEEGRWHLFEEGRLQL